MPSTKEKKLNIFQRPFRGIANFRKKHPYWFAFIVGTVVGLLLAGAVTTMIFAPHLTPAFLMGAKLFVAKMGLAAVVSTFAGGGVVAGVFLGALFSGAKRLFDSFRSCFRKPLLKRAVVEKMLSNSSKIISEKLNGSRPSHSSTALPSSSTKMEADPNPSSLTSFPNIESKETSGSVNMAQPDEATIPNMESEEDKKARVAKEAKDSFMKAAKRYEVTRNEILSDFDAAIKMAIAIPEVEGDFQYNVARSTVIERIKGLKRSFIQGDLFIGNVRDIFTDKISSAATEVKSKLQVLRGKIESSDYRDYQESEKQIEAINSQAHGQKRQVTKSRGQLGSIYADVDAYEAKLKEIETERKEKIRQVHLRFFEMVEKAKAAPEETEDTSHQQRKRFG